MESADQGVRHSRCLVSVRLILREITMARRIAGPSLSSDPERQGMAVV